MKKLKTKIFISYLCLALSLIFALSLLSYSKIYSISLAKIAQSRGEVLDGIRDNIDSLTNMLLFATNIGGFSRSIRLSQYAKIKDDPYAVLQFNKQVEAYFNNFSDTYRYLNIQYYVMLNTFSGYNFNNIPESIKTNNLADVYDWVEKVKQLDGKILWVPTYNDFPVFGYDRYVFTAARIVKEDYSTTPIGLLYLVVNESALYNCYKHLQTESNEVLIIDEEGRIVSHRDKSLIGQQWAYSGLLTDESAKSYGILENDGQSLIVVQRYLKSTNWRVVEVAQASSIMQQLDDFKVYLLTLLVISILICIIITYILSLHLTVPITRLSKGMEKVSAGDLNVKLQGETGDEIGMLVAGFNKMIFDIRRLFDNVKKEQQLKNEAEIKYLQAQINPHFIYNTLNSTRCMIQMGQSEDASKIMILLTRLIRNVLDNKELFVTLDEEIDRLKDYVEIQKLCCSNNLSMICDISGNVHAALIPKLILQPLVENSIFHGIGNKPGNGIIHIRAEKAEDDSLVITVSDNGDGIGGDKLASLREALKHGSEYVGSHIGLANIQNRIKQIYGMEYGLSIDSVENEGTVITLRIPFRPGVFKNSQTYDTL